MTEDSDHEGPERRAAVRVQGPLPGELALDVESEVLLLSSGGMMIRLPFALPLDSAHRFTLVVEEAVIEVVGRVRNCRAVDGGMPAYEIGIEFEGLDELRRGQLERFVADKLEF